MSERMITVGAAQMGPIAARESRADVVERLLAPCARRIAAAAILWSIRN